MSQLILPLLLMLAAPSPAEEILGLMQSGKYSQALRTSAEAARMHPRDIEVRNLHGLMLLTTLQNEAAAGEFRKVIELNPDHAEAHANLGLALIQLNDEAGAEPHLEKAFKLDPGNLDNKREYQELKIRKRIRSGTKSIPAEGTPAHDIHQFMTLLERGEMETAFDRYVDPRKLEEFARKVAGSSFMTTREKREIMRGFKQGFNSQVMHGGGKYEGFEVQPAMVSGDLTEVQAYVLVQRVMTAANVARMKHLIDSPELAEFISPDILMVFRGLDPADRNAMFDRQVGLRQNQLFPVRWQMRKDEDGRRLIQDAVLGSPDLIQVSVSDLIRKMDAFIDLGTVANPDFPGGRSSSPYQIGYRIGKIFGYLAVIAFLVFIVVRFARRYSNKP